MERLSLENWLLSQEPFLPVLAEWMGKRMVLKKKSPANKSENVKKDLRDYARYSTLAFRLIIIVLLGFFAGMKLDQWLELKNPIFTVVLASAGLFLSIYLLIKDLLK